MMTDGNRWTDPARLLIAALIVDAVAAGLVPAVVSAVGLIEVLVGPARHGDAIAFESTAEALDDLPIEVTRLDSIVAEDAAWIRGAAGIGVEDAIHLASARASGATAFVTNDRRFRSLANIEVFYLDDLVA